MRLGFCFAGCVGVLHGTVATPETKTAVSAPMKNAQEKNCNKNTSTLVTAQ